MLLVTACVLEIFFDSRRSRSSMFLKSMLPPTLSWYVRSSTTPRSSNSLASTRCVMVAPTWLLMSSPTIGTPASSNFLAHSGVAGDEDRQRVDEGDLRVDRALRVELVGLLRAHRQVRDQHVDPGVLEDLDDVDRLVVGLVDGLAVVLAETVERVAALHGHAERRHVSDLDGVVLAGDDGVGEVEADLLGVDVERGDELDVAHVVRAELDVHEPGHAGSSGRRPGSSARPARGTRRSCRRRRWLRGPNSFRSPSLLGRSAWLAGATGCGAVRRAGCRAAGRGRRGGSCCSRARCR